MLEKRETSGTVGGNVIWYSHIGKQYEVSSKKKKIKLELLYDLAIPLVDMYPEKNYNSRTYMHPYVHSGIIYNSQDIETGKYPLRDEWIKKMWYICMCVYTYNGILLSYKKIKIYCPLKEQRCN